MPVNSMYVPVSMSNEYEQRPNYNFICMSL